MRLGHSPTKVTNLIEKETWTWGQVDIQGIDVKKYQEKP